MSRKTQKQLKNTQKCQKNYITLLGKLQCALKAPKFTFTPFRRKKTPKIEVI